MIGSLGGNAMRRAKNLLFMLAATLLWALTAPGDALTAEDGSYKTAGGLAVYLGVLPAAMVQGHPKDHAEDAMHGGVPSGRHAVHLMAAVFEAANGARIEDAAVEASVTPIADAAAHVAGVTRRLEPMVIAGTVTYGNYFTMRGDGPYRIVLTISQAEAAKSLILEFSYDHWTR
jgi:hypothetical protein